MKYLKTTSIFLGLLLAIVLAAIFFAGFTQTGTRLAWRLVAPLVNSDTLTVSLEEPGALLSGRLTAKRITIADADDIWLEIDDLDAKWSPAELFNAALDIQSLKAKAVKLDRLPESGDSSDESSGGLPLGLKVGDISIPEMTLGQSFSGKVERLSMAGSLELESARSTADLHLTDLNRGDAEIDAKLDYDVAKNNLMVDMVANEENGGFVSSLLQLPGSPALKIAVQGEGPLNNWKGEARGMLDGKELVRFSANYQQAGLRKNVVALKGGGALGSLLPPALRSIFAGETSLDLEAEITPEGTVGVRRGLVQTDTLEARISGTYSSAGENDLIADVKAVNGTADFNFLNEDGGWRALVESARLSVTGPAEAAKAKIDAKVGTLQIPSGEINGISLEATSDSLDLKNQQGRLATTLSVESSRFSDENIDRLVQAPLTLTAQVDIGDNTISFEDTKLQSASIGGTASGRYDIAGSAGQADFKLFAAPSVLPPEMAEKLTKTSRVEGQVTFSGEGFALPEFAIESELMTASGSASLADEALSADVSGRILKLGVLREDLSGEADFTAEVSGTLSQPSISAELSIDKAQVSGLELVDLSANLEGAVAEKETSGSVRVEGALNGQKVSVKADLKTAEDGTYEIPDIEAEIGTNRIKGALDISKDFAPSGAFDFDLPDLALLGAIAGQELKGDLSGKAKIGQKDGELVAAVDARGEEITYGTSKIEKPKINVTAQGALISGTVETDKITAGENRIEAPKLVFDRNGDEVRFEFNARYDSADAEASGTIRTGDTTRIELEALSAKPRGIPITLKEPAGIEIADGVTRIENTALSVGSGSLNVQGTAGETLAIKAELSKIPASLANAFAKDLGAQGSISGTVNVSGSVSDPQVAYDLNLAGGSVAQMRSNGVGDLSVSAKGNFGGSKLSLDLSGKGPAGLSIDGTGSLDIKGNSLSIKLSGPIPASLLNGVTARQGISFSGTAKSDISVSGSMASPKIGGTISLNGLGVDLVRQNISVRDLAGEVRLEGDKARLAGVKGNFSNGGGFTASGTVGLSGSFPADLTINLNGVDYTDGDLVAAKLGGEVKITGGLAANPTIAGDIKLDEANITIPETLPTSIKAINLKHKNAPADVRRQYAEISPSDSGTGNQAAANLKLTISAPNRVFVRGRGMDAELGGTVSIAGTTASPIVSGGFEMIRGRLGILGKRLDFTSGKIGFAGGLVPDLDLNATSTVGSTTIIIGVDGAADDPEFSFTSSPSLPEDEVLAQLVFQQSSSSLSPFQIAQLADAVAQLTGASSGSVFSKLREAGGLDNLDVTSDDEGNAEVKAGKYLNSKTYFEVQQNAGTGSGKAIINLDVGGGVKLRGEADSEGEGAAGIFYEKEY